MNISGDSLTGIGYSKPSGEKKDNTLDLATSHPISKDRNKNNVQINIDYLEPKNSLEDYIIDTGDTIFIKFENKPRGLGSIESNYDPEKLSYLQPRKDLKNYFLDSRDVLDIKFTYVPELNSIKQIDQEGEIYLPEIGSVYLRGLNIYQVKDLLEKKYDEYLKFSDLEIRIKRFRFVDSGIYKVNNEGEVFLPLLDEIYVRGLTTNEISNLLSRKYLNSEGIYTNITTRITGFKSQRILISGEVRNPGVYRLPGYNSGAFFQVESIKDDKSQNKEIDGDNITQGQDNSEELINSFDENDLNNTTRQNFQIKRPSENFTTISNVIKRAGGITSKTDLSRIEIIRDIPIGKGGGKKRAIVDFTSFLNDSDPTNDIRLFDGDRIFVPKLASGLSDIVPKSILSGLSPRFITVRIFGRVANPGKINLPLEASLSDAIDLTGPIKPLSGRIVLIRYNKDGTILKQNISYSSRARRGSKRNPFLLRGDLITVQNGLVGKTAGVIREITLPFIGIYSTVEVIEGFSE